MLSLVLGEPHFTQTLSPFHLFCLQCGLFDLEVPVLVLQVHTCHKVSPGWCHRDRGGEGTPAEKGACRSCVLTGDLVNNSTAGD